MRILCVETDPRAADLAADQLRAAGHEVASCRTAPGSPAFPCAGLTRRGACPVEDARGVDVVLDVRRRPMPRPTPDEAGVTCALRRGVPLVVAGNVGLNPFEPWTTAVAPGASNVVAACEDAYDRALAALAGTVTATIAEVLAEHGHADPGVRTEARRVGRDLAVVVHRGDAAGDLDGVLAVRAHRALRDAGVATPSISISCTA
jgi:hypothetical protein